jgi:hypothetical protein
MYGNSQLIKTDTAFSRSRIETTVEAGHYTQNLRQGHDE